MYINIGVPQTKLSIGDNSKFSELENYIQIFTSQHDFMGSSTVLRTLSQIVILAILARILIPEQFGIIISMTIIISFSAIISQLGIMQGVIQIPNFSNKHISSAFSYSIISHGTIYLVLFIFANNLSNIFNNSFTVFQLRIYSVILLIKVLFYFQRSYLNDMYIL